MKTLAQQRQAAKAFAKEWEGRGYEEGETQKFWLQLLNEVFGVEKPYAYIDFEERVKIKSTKRIDAHIPSTHVIIEQKSAHVNLHAAQQQSDGKKLTAAEQAERYTIGLSYSDRPRWIITCNFVSFFIYDLEHPNSEPEEVLLKNLGKEIHRLGFLVNQTATHIKKEDEVSFKAGAIVGELYDEILKAYKDPAAESTLKSLNQLCVRLVFCLYAEDAAIFGKKDMFHDYLITQSDLRRALIDLFKVLDTKIDDRDPYLSDELAAFPYVNGGLFRGEIEIPRLNDRVRALLLQRASENFDWSEISPTIFGALFESTLNPETRREGGMHYTEVENIHKVIDPLFLNDLRAELESIKAQKDTKGRTRNLHAYQQKLASLLFFDPACGSGNFLTETYLSLRRIENEVIALINRDQMTMGDISNPIQVSINQFYGIEINDFAATVAATALWIAEAQMMEETEQIVRFNLDPLPLKSYTNITEGNALQLDWRECVPVERLNYIIGNPPFYGARNMTAEQKADLLMVFGAKWRHVGNLDYVCGWYRKAAELMQEHPIRTALVSTNSITQGEQVANLWKPLMEEFGVHIDFAHRTFKWNSQANEKAHVHCVIVGCSVAPFKSKKYLFEGNQTIEADHINAYLLDAEDVFVESRPKPLCQLPEIGIGNKPIDGGHYLFTQEERDDFVKKEPAAAPYFRRWYGADEFINNKVRYCLWLGECSPVELCRMPLCMERIERVRQLRLASPSAGTRKLADTPTRFHVENIPDAEYIIIPKVSSERRIYIPIGFMDNNALCSDLCFIVPQGGLFHFGVLTSKLHMVWLSTVGGRLKSDYRYSKDVVYNNYPWPTPTEAQRTEVERCAQAVLDARNLYEGATLGEMYSKLYLFTELQRAHQKLDRAVEQCYRPENFSSDSEMLEYLFTMYQDLTK